MAKKEFSGIGGFGGMPDWFGSLSDDLKEKFTEWYGDLLRSVTQSQNLQNVNGAVSLAGFRPAQYTSARQRVEAAEAAQAVSSPEAASAWRADKLARLNFHGGMVNGKWISDYDTWKAAGGTSAGGTDANGKIIKVPKLAFKVSGGEANPLTGKDMVAGVLHDRVVDGPPATDGRRPTVKSSMRGSAQTVMNEMSRRAGGAARGVSRNPDGTMTYFFGDNARNAQVKSGLSSSALAAREKLRIIGSNSEVSEKGWLFDDKGKLKKSPKGNKAAADGGQAALAMRPRGWLDAVFGAGISRAAICGGRTRR